MSSNDLMHSEIVISSNNTLSKAEKEKELWRFLGTSNTVIHKTKYQQFSLKLLLYIFCDIY